jgi:hypothetical protein
LTLSAGTAMLPRSKQVASKRAPNRSAMIAGSPHCSVGRDPPVRCEHPAHLGDDNVGTRRKNMPELAEHGVERSIGIWKCLGIASDPHDVLVLRNPTVLASLFEQFRRKIQRRHPCSGPRSADSHHTGARRLQESVKLLNAPTTRVQAREDHAAPQRRPGNLR